MKYYNENLKEITIKEAEKQRRNQQRFFVFLEGSGLLIKIDGGGKK